MIELGDLVMDVVTKIESMVVSKTEYVGGQVSFGIQERSSYSPRNAEVFGPGSRFIVIEKNAFDRISKQSAEELRNER